ncbi:DUF1254 domain-containing protein [Sinorhizobium sp. BG8]|uniref:DUF1254 domain-containing protein n=1 Tax=Sinorhizobium sp. BG8 TaxID=2613773 RepID=UPI00193CDA45|nr:DUF1254 domain-containing protein [Sinorhizobium sp. BG8]QRM54701.1 DUF1254 domain-containing protein [Sinorhizobium sp. BG8]
MRSVLYAVLIGLVGAAVLHIIIILSLPSFSDRDAYTRVEAFGEQNRFFPLSGDGAPDTGLVSDDPNLLVAVCAFSTEETPVHFTAPGDVPFWSIAIFDTGSNEVFSMNDRTSVDRTLDLLVASPIQLTGIRKSLPEELTQSILVGLSGDEGYAVLRTFVPTLSQAAAAREFLSDAGCEQFTSS